MELVQNILLGMALWAVGITLAIALGLMPTVLLVGWRKWAPLGTAAVVTVFVGLGFISGWCVPEPRLTQECYLVLPLFDDPLTMISIVGDLLVGFALLWGLAALFHGEDLRQRKVLGLRRRLTALFIDVSIGTLIGIVVPWTLSLLASIWYLAQLPKDFVL